MVYQTGVRVTVPATMPLDSRQNASSSEDLLLFEPLKIFPKFIRQHSWGEPGSLDPCKANSMRDDWPLEGVCLCGHGDLGTWASFLCFLSSLTGLTALAFANSKG